MSIHKSGEDFLEASLGIHSETCYCRSIDVVPRLGGSKPSVSVAMGILREEGKLTVTGEGLLEFTPEGRALAEQIYGRHCLMAQLLRKMGVSERIAQEDACKMEHDLAPETYEKIAAFLNALTKHGEETP